VIRIGCCGFPVKREKYASRFRLVEVQKTFYQPPRLPNQLFLMNFLKTA